MISKEKKAAIMKEYARTEGDTGSPEVQVAVLTARIQELTEHFSQEKKSQQQTMNRNCFTTSLLMVQNRL